MKRICQEKPYAICVLLKRDYAILKEKNVRIELVKMDGKEECNRTVKVEQSDI